MTTDLLESRFGIRPSHTRRALLHTCRRFKGVDTRLGEENCAGVARLVVLRGGDFARRGDAGEVAVQARLAPPGDGVTALRKEGGGVRDVATRAERDAGAETERRPRKLVPRLEVRPKRREVR